MTFTFGTAFGYNVNGIYADVVFNYMSGAYVAADTYADWHASNVNPHPTIDVSSLNIPIIADITVKADVNSIDKVEYTEEYKFAADYATYGWVKWDGDVEQKPLHLVSRLTINEPDYQGDASLLGDRTLGIWLNDDGNLYFATYNFEYNAGSDNIDRYSKVDYGDDLGDWFWVYYGYERASMKTIIYVRFRDREVTLTQEANRHFMPKYFGLYLANSDIATNGWNGQMKCWNLCMGSDCARSENFEELNEAMAISDDLDTSDDASLGAGEPGCIVVDACENGLYDPFCGNATSFEGSAEVTINWPEISKDDLIPCTPEDVIPVG